VISFKVIKESLALKKNDIKSAKFIVDPNGNDSVLLILTEAAAKQMSQFTKNHIGHKMALIIDNKIISQPVIRSAIGGQLQVTFQSDQEAKRFYERLIA
jgi:preprotein translocase subunit SecD